MIKLFTALLAVLVNLIVYFLFGSLITGRFKRSGFSATVSVMVGFFLMLIVFDLCCFPVMLKFRPLSLLSRIWLGVTVLLCLVSALVNFRLIRDKLKDILSFVRENKLFVLGLILITGTELVLICGSYDFTLDASYYVARVTTDVATDTINIYDPYTGDWTDHFEFRYFFSTYPTLCAVACDLTGIHPLTYMKLVMCALTVIMYNAILFITAEKIFADSRKKQLLLLFLAGVMLFFFSSIYTPAQFLVTRGYEGKSILGNVVLPAIIFLCLTIVGDAERKDSYIYLFIICLGATALSNSANMLLPVMLFSVLLPAFIIYRKKRILLCACACALPCMILLLMYVAYVRGMFVFYTYPR